VVRWVSLLFRALPLDWALALGRAIGWFWYYIIPVRRGVALANVRRALGDTVLPVEGRRIVRLAYQNLMMVFIEALRMPEMTEALLRERIRLENFDEPAAAARRGKGLILVAAHMGSFELLMAAQGLCGGGMWGVLKGIKSRAVNDFIFANRERCGVHAVPPRRSKDQIRALLNEGKAVAFALDQHMAQHRAVVCSFFGQLASTTPAPARFAFETGAAIFPVVIRRDPERPGHHVARMEHEFVLETPYATREENIWHNSERLNRIVEGWIRETPEQYFWLHKRWKVHDQPAGWSIPAQLQHLVTQR
jgi:Kdo2-lipid IVA lauroyltransferase/acyltransferase